LPEYPNPESTWYTPGFSAPELHKSKSAVDHRADIYSVAAVWYFLLLELEFDYKKDLEGQLEPFDDVNRRILRAALRADPAERPTDLSEFREGIQELKRTQFNPIHFLDAHAGL
jgi:serine/threonine protein kinase